MLPWLISSAEAQCDEKRPVCGHCVKQRRRCEFSGESADPSNAREPLHGASCSPNDHPAQPEDVAASLSTPSTPGTLGVVPPNAQPHVLTDAFLLDLSLMRHYALTTSLLLAGRTSFNVYWQDVIPQEAESHPFLMHGLLAITALHLANSHPSQQRFYYDVAVRHQDMAIILFRPTLSALTEENSAAVFAYSAVAAMIAFALPQVSGTPPADPIADLLAIFKLMRGIYAVLDVARGSIARSKLGPLIAFEQDLAMLPAPTDAVGALHALAERNRVATEDELVREVYGSVIRNLLSVFEQQLTSMSSRARAFSWPIMITSAFPVALARREPMALAILAHYGVILHDSRECWWFGTWGRWVVDAVSGALPQEWQVAIQWPKDKIAETN
ncbi:hypothetical protein MMC26_001078 [Xylographa opegraphella]|nr:hypothetical protein [Xylographa opegraphella]